MMNWTNEWNYTWNHFFSTTYLKHDATWTTIFLSAYMFIFLLGLLGNLSVIVVIYKSSFMRIVTNLFILSLAFADLFVVIFCLPSTLLVTIFVPWVFNNALCKTLPYIQGASVFASVYSLVAISIDRSTAFYRPVGNGNTSNGFTKSLANRLILLIWVLGLLAHSPLLFVFQVIYSLEESDYGIAYCWEIWDNPDNEIIFFVAVPFATCFTFPLIVICISNIVIWWNLRRFENMSKKQQHPLKYDTGSETKMLWVISVTFLICWTPLLALVAKVKFIGPFSSEKGEINLQDVLMAVAQLMGSCNSCINPVLYAYHNGRFRACLASLFRKNQRRRRRRRRRHRRRHC